MFSALVECLCLISGKFFHIKVIKFCCLLSSPWAWLSCHARMWEGLTRDTQVSPVWWAKERVLQTHSAMHTCTRSCMCTPRGTQFPLLHPQCLFHPGLAFVPPGPLSIPPGTRTWLASLLWPCLTFGSTLQAMLRVRGVSQTSERGPASQVEGESPCNVEDSMAQEAEFP